MVQIRIVEQRGSVGAISNARASWNDREGLLLIIDEADLQGVGEASPLPGYSRETIEDCRTELERFEPNLSDPLDQHLQLPAARFAAETAILDLIAKRSNRSIAGVLGQARDRVPLSAIVQEDGDVQRAIDRGITTVKLKVGGEGDVARVAALRSKYGDRIALRLDANQAWSSAEAERAMRAFAPFAPELIEEPTAEWDRIHPHLPLALDESLQTMPDERVVELAQKKIIAALILKPMALGGFSRCLHLARLAAAHDLACIVTHLFDGPVALGAAAELALALPGRVLACGLDRHRGLSAWPDHPLPQIGENEIVAIG